METLSEQLFEKLCTQYGVRFRCLCKTQSKTPDYLILLEKTRVIVEIKQFDMRGEDELIWEKVNEGQTVAYFPDTVKRIRKDIKRASKQIKLPNSKPCPKVIILYDNTGGISDMSNENILNSMLGNEQILIIEDKLSNSLRLGNSKFGGGRTTTISEKNYLSAIGRLRNDLTLDIFHNPYASCPLNRHHAKLFANHQFFIQKPINSFYSMWHVWEPTDTL